MDAILAMALGVHSFLVGVIWYEDSDNAGRYFSFVVVPRSGGQDGALEKIALVIGPATFGCFFGKGAICTGTVIFFHFFRNNFLSIANNF